jgi:gamma-glutamyltranspeptidase / glutathione hydrolase
MKLAALLFLGMTAMAQAEDARRPLVGRSLVTTRYGIVASSQPLAARAGTLILERGGNAVDAAIATNAAVGVMEPAMNGIGGDLFVLYWDAKAGKLHGLNASGWAATGLTPQSLAAKGVTTMPRDGAASVTVPGAVAGWQALRDTFGTKPLSELLAPAIHYASEGFPVGEITAEAWAAASGRVGAPTASRTYLPDGRPPRAGQPFKNPDLARTLSRIAERGRDGFYKGETADAIVRTLREAGGTMTLADLAELQPEWVEPISTQYRGWTVSEIPPNTQGIAALMMLEIMETFPLGEWGFHSPRALHAMIEAKKLAYADMLRYVGDPRASSIPVTQLLDPARAARRAKQVDMAKAACGVAPDRLAGLTDAKGGDTIYLSVVDKDGNIVSLIQSVFSAFGSGIVPEGSGFVLHNRGGLFTLDPGHPNTLAPRKRPLHTIIPGFMQKDGVQIGFGIMGGFNQAQAHAQFVAGIADYGFTIQEALEAGRFTKPTFAGCDVEIEALVPEATRAELQRLGHQLLVVPPRHSNFGWGQAVMSRPDGVHFGASEPRHDGAAIPESPRIFGAAALGR